MVVVGGRVWWTTTTKIYKTTQGRDEKMARLFGRLDDRISSGWNGLDGARRGLTDPEAVCSWPSHPCRFFFRPVSVRRTLECQVQVPGGMDPPPIEEAHARPRVLRYTVGTTDDTPSLRGQFTRLQWSSFLITLTNRLSRINYYDDDSFNH